MIWLMIERRGENVEKVMLFTNELIEKGRIIKMMKISIKITKNYLWEKQWIFDVNIGRFMSTNKIKE